MQNKKLREIFSAALLCLSLGCTANGAFNVIDGMRTSTGQDNQNATACAFNAKAKQPCTTAQVKSLLALREANDKKMAGFGILIMGVMLASLSRDIRKKPGARAM
jgi:hypothetical protein